MNELSPLPSETTSGLEIFTMLSAEEESNLNAYFVPPSEFEHMTGERSVIVFGESGSGKTTLYRKLRELCFKPKGNLKRLLVDWCPTPLPDGSQNGLSAVRQHAIHLLDACGIRLAKYLAEYPQSFELSPRWTQSRIIWFIQCSIQGELLIRLGPLVETDSQPGAALLRQITESSVAEILYNPSPEHMIKELLPALRRMELEGIWVMADGLEGWVMSEPERLTQSLKGFLSALSLFEQSGLVFKFCLPAHLETALKRASGVARRRLDAYHLEWDELKLYQIIEKRLALVMGQDGFTLGDLCSAPKLGDWLKRVGGNSPREWLDQIRPLVQHYYKNQLSEPIDNKAWKVLRCEHPPRFWMDETGRKVKVGGREIPLDDVPTKAYDMLRYLYQRSGEVVSKDELYYLVYLGLESVPSSPIDKHYETLRDYSGVIDTSLYRLRQAIEPDPSNPVILQTVRGHGVRLVSYW